MKLVRYERQPGCLQIALSLIGGILLIYSTLILVALIAIVIDRWPIENAIYVLPVIGFIVSCDVFGLVFISIFPEIGFNEEGIFYRTTIFPIKRFLPWDSIKGIYSFKNKILDGFNAIGIDTKDSSKTGWLFVERILAKALRFDLPIILISSKIIGFQEIKELINNSSDR